MCPLDELKRVRRQITARSEIHVVDGANHSLEVGKRRLREQQATQEEVERGILNAMGAFLKRWA